MKPEGRTLFHAVKEGHTELVKLLIDGGVDVNTKGEYDETLLHIAAKEGHTEIAELLIKKGANLNARDEYGRTPLHGVGYKAEFVKLLIENGADVNARDNDGQTPLGLALKLNNHRTADELRKHGAKE